MADDVIEELQESLLQFVSLPWEYFYWKKLTFSDLFYFCSVWKILILTSSW